MLGEGDGWVARGCPPRLPPSPPVGGLRASPKMSAAGAEERGAGAPGSGRAAGESRQEPKTGSRVAAAAVRSFYLPAYFSDT